MHAARISDNYICPAADGDIPHVGGTIVGPGVANVIIEGLPAAVVGDSLVCNGAGDYIIGGSSTVLIAGKPAARMGDPSAHGGSIIQGSVTVLIG
jgi:uncharacterized Zn-binding protein involved in type VI secretion